MRSHACASANTYLAVDVRPRRWLALELGASAALLAITAAAGGGGYASRPLGLGVVGGVYSFGEVELVKSSGVRGEMFNDRAAGGLISFSLGPAVKPVVDARPNPDDPEGAAEYERARTSRNDFLTYLGRYDVNMVLLRVEPANLPILRLLGNDQRWVLANDGLKQGFYVRKDALQGAHGEAVEAGR